MPATPADILQASIRTKQQLLAAEDVLQTVETVVTLIVETFKAGGKVLFCGNGGSAADAQHLAAEFSGRFYTDRTPLPAEALHVNGSYLTAVANDYGYEQVYSRAVRGHGKRGDVLVSLSTSGNSANIVRAMETASSMGIYNVAFTGQGGGKMAAFADHLIEIPSTDTPRIQECHITLGHAVCQLVEDALFAKSEGA